MLKLVNLLFFREIKKSYFIIILAIILITSFVVNFLSYNHYESDNNLINVQSKLNEEEFLKLYPNRNYNRYVELYEDYIDEVIKATKLNNYEIVNNLYSFDTIYQFQVFLSIISIIVGSSLLMNEFKCGTIKHFLVKKYSRFKIYFAFFLTVVLLVLLINLFLFISYTLSMICVDKSFDLLYITKSVVLNDKVVDINYYYLTFTKFICNSLPIIFVGILSFFISLALFNKVFSISFMFFVNVFGLVIFQWLLNFDISFLMYSFLPYLDYTIFNDRLSLVEFNMQYGTNLSLFNGNLLLFVYAILGFVISSLLFLKKDIN